MSRITPLFLLLFALFVPPLCFELEQGVAWDWELWVVPVREWARRGPGFLFELHSDPGC